jgi:uroporphyrinogen decarboxylase
MRPLTCEEVVSVIEGRSTAPRVPIEIHFWVHPETFGKREPAVRSLLSNYPEDLQIISFRIPDIFTAPPDAPGYRWVPYDDPYIDQSVPYDQRIAIKDWSQLDEIIKNFPRPDYVNLLRSIPPADGRYRLGHWWYCFFERHWSLRGMTNALTDYYDYPQQVHRLFRALTDYYKGIMERGRNEAFFDAIFTSDDLGTQTRPFFSLEVFRKFYKPYYQELIDKAHELGMHFWLHACGNVQPFIPEWIEIGLDVLHPIQKHTMNEVEIAAKYGSQIAIWSGLDVQQVIPWGTPDEVRAEVRRLMDIYWRKNEGRMLLTAGNGINEDCPLASLQAFFDESMIYGAIKASGGAVID